VIYFNDEVQPILEALRSAQIMANFYGKAVYINKNLECLVIGYNGDLPLEIVYPDGKILDYKRTQLFM
jgi:hypothetical protein